MVDRKRRMAMDWDGRDLSQPFTVIGLLSEAITIEVNTPEDDGLVEKQIEYCWKRELRYRW